MYSIGVLKGHCKRDGPSVKWSNEDERNFISTGFDQPIFNNFCKIEQISKFVRPFRQFQHLVQSLLHKFQLHLLIKFNYGCVHYSP